MKSYFASGNGSGMDGIVDVRYRPIADIERSAQSAGMRGLIAIVLVTSAGMAGAWAWANHVPLNDAERELFDRLDRVTASGNPTSLELVRAFGLPPPCLGGHCSFQQPAATNSSFSTGSLRPSDGGLIFELERPRSQCIRVSRVVAHFGGSESRNGCADSECWYVDARHEWGLLAFGLETRSATCVASVVINTASYQRAHNQPR